MTRVDDLRSDYDRLGVLLLEADGRDAAGLARERRMIGELLDALESPVEVTLVDKLAGNVTVLDVGRGTTAGASGSASRRRKSG